jgi:small-conductance mechanosensitive channel
MRIPILIISVFLFMAASAGVSSGATEKPHESKALKRLNRQIVVFRSHTAPRTPDERATEARKHMLKARTLLYKNGVTTTNIIIGDEQAIRFSCSNIYLFTVLESDLDQLSGETLADVKAQALAQIDSIVEARKQMLKPGYVLRGTGIVVLATLLLLGAIWLVRFLGRRISGTIDKRIKKLRQLRIYRADLRPHIMLVVKRLIGLVVFIVILFFIYIWLTTSLYQFPATIPWATDLGDLFNTFIDYIGTGILEVLPNLCIVVLIFLVARWLSRLCSQLIKGLGPSGRATSLMSLDTARATRRILVAFIWLIAIVMAYPYIPGSGSVAFRGVSVLFGLMVSLGATGMVNQVMSGFVMLYSGSIRTGEYVKVGSIEGTVTEMGMLAIKVMTPRHDFISVPNAVLVSNPTYNYSRLAEEYGAVTTTAITIGYDAPWRQVHAMLKLAAERTPGVRKEPEPRILQTGLLDHYVEYTLVFYVEKPSDRPAVLSRLHAEIQDSFNEYEVQIMSPHFRAQPEEEIIVPKSRWFESPAELPKEEAGTT